MSMCTGSETVNPDLPLLCVTCPQLEHLFYFCCQQVNKARAYLATCEVYRKGLAILLARDNHCTCKLLTAPASTIPALMMRLDLLRSVCPCYHSFSNLTCPQADDTQACQPRAPAQTICIASPSPRLWTLTAGVKYFVITLKFIILFQSTTWPSYLLLPGSTILAVQHGLWNRLC